MYIHKYIHSFSLLIPYTSVFIRLPAPTHQLWLWNILTFSHQLACGGFRSAASPLTWSVQKHAGLPIIITLLLLLCATADLPAHPAGHPSGPQTHQGHPRVRLWDQERALQDGGRGRAALGATALVRMLRLGHLHPLPRLVFRIRPGDAPPPLTHSLTHSDTPHTDFSNQEKPEAQCWYLEESEGLYLHSSN